MRLFGWAVAVFVLMAVTVVMLAFGLGSMLILASVIAAVGRPHAISESLRLFRSSWRTAATLIWSNLFAVFIISSFVHIMIVIWSLMGPETALMSLEGIGVSMAVLCWAVMACPVVLVPVISTLQFYTMWRDS